MPYVLYQFDDLALPAYNGVTDVGSGRYDAGLLQLAGTLYDLRGSDQSARQAMTLTKRCTILETTPAALRTTYNALRAKAGRRGRLWRLWDDGTMEWCWARMQEIPAVRDQGGLTWLELELSFVMVSPAWHGRLRGVWTLNDGECLNAGLYLNDVVTTLTTAPQTVTLTNNGNRDVTAVRITVTATADPIESVDLLIADLCQLTYVGTINTSLVIDTGARSVTVDGVDGWAGLAFGADHCVDDWLRLEPGDTSVAVTISNGANPLAGTIDFYYREAWE